MNPLSFMQNSEATRTKRIQSPHYSSIGLHHALHLRSAAANDSRGASAKQVKGGGADSSPSPNRVFYIGLMALEI